MPNFKFTEEDYLKKIDEALNMPLEKIQGAGIDPQQALAKVLGAARLRKQIPSVRSTPR